MAARGQVRVRQTNLAPAADRPHPARSFGATEPGLQLQGHHDQQEVFGEISDAVPSWSWKPGGGPRPSEVVGEMYYVPTRNWAGNLFYMLASHMAHNVMRELQMQTTSRRKKSDPKRAAMWTFERLETARNKWVRRAGRLNRLNGKLALTMSRSDAVQAGSAKVVRGLKAAV